MSVITIRLSEHLLNQVDNLAKLAHMPRAEYIRHAIEVLNKETRAKAERVQIRNASLKVRSSSMRVNKEFSEVESDPET